MSVGIEETRDGVKAAVELLTMRKFDDLAADMKQDIKDGAAKLREMGGDLKESFDEAAAKGRKRLGIAPAEDLKGSQPVNKPADTKKLSSTSCKQ